MVLYFFLYFLFILFIFSIAEFLFYKDSPYDMCWLWFLNIIFVFKNKNDKLLQLFVVKTCYYYYFIIKKLLFFFNFFRIIKQKQPIIVVLSHFYFCLLSPDILHHFCHLVFFSFLYFFFIFQFLVCGWARLTTGQTQTMKLSPLSLRSESKRVGQPIYSTLMAIKVVKQWWQWWRMLGNNNNDSEECCGTTIEEAK